MYFYEMDQLQHEVINHIYTPVITKDTSSPQEILDKINNNSMTIQDLFIYHQQLHRVLSEIKDNMIALTGELTLLRERVDILESRIDNGNT